MFAARRVGNDGFGRDIAIKRMNPGLSADTESAAVLAREAQIGAQLRHPNIVQTFDCERDDDGALCLVMELVDGVNLAALTETGPIPLEVATFITAEVLRALGFAHEHVLDDGREGVVHRDVSPRNILLSWDGTVKLADFGIARASGHRTTASFPLGTAPYMSPEQASSSSAYASSDQFSLGVVFWEMLSGSSLFVRRDLQSTLEAVLSQPIVAPDNNERRVPSTLSAAALRMLDRDPAGRFPDANAALAEILATEHAVPDARDRLIALLAARFHHRATNVSERAQVRVGFAHTLQRPRGRLHRGVALGLVAALAAAVIALGAVTLGRSASSDSEGGRGALAPPGDASLASRTNIGLHTDPSGQKFVAAGATTAQKMLPPTCERVIALLRALATCKAASPEFQAAFQASLDQVAPRIQKMADSGADAESGCASMRGYLEQQAGGCDVSPAKWDPPASTVPVSDDLLVKVWLPSCVEFARYLETRSRCSKESRDWKNSFTSLSRDFAMTYYAGVRTWGAVDASRKAINDACAQSKSQYEHLGAEQCR